MRVGSWIYSSNGEGWPHVNGGISNRIRHFPKASVGQIRSVHDDRFSVWFIGLGEVWDIKKEDARLVDVVKTGDKHQFKICNICHRYLPTTRYDKNQNNLHGAVRRPSCRDCRTDIDKRAPKSSQARAMERRRPHKGTPFTCPICMKRSIVGVTAKILADHNHHTGDIRDFICDSCNTGLGRFKNGENYLQNAIQYLKERDPEEVG